MRSLTVSTLLSLTRVFCVSFYLAYTYIINIYDYMSIKNFNYFFWASFF
nr:MAG TPA: hypothetical protein [Caudoviricetes sp.]